MFDRGAHGDDDGGDDFSGYDMAASRRCLAIVRRDRMRRAQVDAELEDGRACDPC